MIQHCGLALNDTQVRGSNTRDVTTDFLNCLGLSSIVMNQQVNPQTEALWTLTPLSSNDNEQVYRITAFIAVAIAQTHTTYYQLNNINIHIHIQ